MCVACLCLKPVRHATCGICPTHGMSVGSRLPEGSRDKVYLSRDSECCCVVQNGSLCDSTEVQIDDDEALARLWSTLLPYRGRWHEAVEPARSAVLLRALVAHLQHPATSTSLRWPVRMRTASSAPAPLRTFNYQSRLRLRSFGSSKHASRHLHAPAEPMIIPHEVRELSITDGVPSLSQISSTASHHSNESASPRAGACPSPTTWAASGSARLWDQGSAPHPDPVLNPISPSSFCPMGPHGPTVFLPPVGSAAHARGEKQQIMPLQASVLAARVGTAGCSLDRGADAPLSPAASPPQTHTSSVFSVFQPATTPAAAKSKATTAAPCASAASQLRTVLQQLSEDVETLLQGQERSQEEALRQMQSISSQLSVRMSRPDGSLGPHHASSRSSMALVHLAAVAEDASPEERPFCDTAVTQSRTRGCAACREAPRVEAPRVRRKLSGLTLSQRKSRFAVQRSDMDKNLLQQATCSAHEHVDAVSPCCAHWQVESSIRCDTSDVSLDPNRDSDAQAVCNDREEDERVSRCHESSSSRLGVEGIPSSDSIERNPGAQDKDPADAGSASEASADMEEENIPLVHALVVRVMHQFAMTKAQH